jgi:ribonuclease P protein component
VIYGRSRDRSECDVNPSVAPAMRFRPEQHLRRQNDIRAVREQGRRLDCRAFTLWWKPREATAAAVNSASFPRVCVIASTNAVGAAVQRNRAKRRLRDVFRHQQKSVPAGCDLLLIARAAANTWPMPELQKQFSDACATIASKLGAPAP